MRVKRGLYTRLWGGVQPVDRTARVLGILVVAGALVVVLIVSKDEETGIASHSGALITTASGDKPVLLDGTEARLLGAHARAHDLRLRVRLRNESGREQLPDPRRVYLVLGARRLYAQPGADRPIRSGEGRTLLRRFELDAAALRDLRRARGRAELRVMPWPVPGSGRAASPGVIRFRVDLAGAQPADGRQT